MIMIILFWQIPDNGFLNGYQCLALVVQRIGREFPKLEMEVRFPPRAQSGECLPKSARKGAFWVIFDRFWQAWYKLGCILT